MRRYTKWTNLWLDPSRKKERRIKSTKLEMKKGEVTTDNGEIQRSVREYYEQLYGNKASLVTQMVKHLPAMWETQVQPLGWEDPLEKEMATHSSILA